LATVLGWLSPRFSFLTPEEFFAAQPGVLLTFDDGMANNYLQALPILEQYSAPAVFFVTTQHLKDPSNWLPAIRRQAGMVSQDQSRVPGEIARDLFDGMSEDQLRSCGDHPLITVGSHTVSHSRLPGCENRTLDWELKESRSYLEQVSGSPVKLFAYPSGDYDRRVAEAVQAAGYEAAFAEEPLGLGMDRFEIPRIGVYSDAHSYLSAKLSGLFQPPLRGKP
jgi:peptidoglycan/xylan/chitin deacetylase (PgdA/CDA1 family)